MNRLLRLAMPCLLLAGCGDDALRAPGTLERDRITLPAPVAERIAGISVREGEPVAAGEELMVLEPHRPGPPCAPGGSPIAIVCGAISPSSTPQCFTSFQS